MSDVWSTSANKMLTDVTSDQLKESIEAIGGFHNYEV